MSNLATIGLWGGPGIRAGSAVANQAPAVSAGADQVLNLPNTIIALDGTVTDDGLPVSPGVVTTTWTKISGPGAVVFADANATDTTATINVAGIYLLQLEADDGELATVDQMQVTVNAIPNTAPQVFAGNDQVIVLPAQASLAGTYNDDGLPDPPATATVAWTQISGPGVTTFSDVSIVNPTASFSVVGVYVLRMTVDDSELQGFDEITITAQATVNQRPVVNAGPDQDITLPNTASLQGSVSDDGLPQL